MLNKAILTIIRPLNLGASIKRGLARIIVKKSRILLFSIYYIF